MKIKTKIKVVEEDTTLKISQNNMKTVKKRTQKYKNKKTKMQEEISRQEKNVVKWPDYLNRRT